MQPAGRLRPLLLAVLSLCLPSAEAQDATRANDRTGLEALYNFADSTGPLVKDRSGAGEPVHLRIADGKSVRRASGSLAVRGETTIRSDKPALRIIDAVRRTGEIAVEAWVRPADARQDGPARLVTISRDSGQRNFTLGQERDQWQVRLRTTRTSTNGMPAAESPRRSVAAKLMHVVYTRDKSGRAQTYVDGKRIAERRIAGATSNWDRSYRLALANELSGDRPWQGTFYFVAIYSRALSAGEIARRFKAGAGAGIERERLAHRKRQQNEKLFTTRVAPLLARRCLQCHNSAARKGKLDLSRKHAALKGGDSGPVVAPGKSADSSLWQSVESNEMPKGAEPLSAKEKRLLKVWIDGGAAWPLETIDADKYVRRRRPDANRLRRLTVEEYIETVRIALGVDVAADARKLLPRDLRADGFSNTAYNLGVDLEHVEAYGKLAGIVVQRLDAAKFAARYTSSRGTDDANLRKLIATMGRWLLRGPVEQSEVDAYLSVAKTVLADGGDFNEAAGYVIEAMLQSPRFIYRMVRQSSDGKSRMLDGSEIASRLSYILWGGPPDAELLRAAVAGELAVVANLQKHAQRMLADPRAQTHSQRFVVEWLNLDRLANLKPNAKRFPRWNPHIAGDMRAETIAFFQEIVWKRNQPLSQLFNAQFTWATPRLAEHYGLTPASSTAQPARYDLSAVPARGGLLTQGSVLTVGGDEASMVTRGLFVLHDVLNGKVEDPPPCVDTTPVPTKPGLSQRAIATARIANAACGGCHARFEPLAFGLEKFDGLGGYHAADHHGNKLREDGEILFPGDAKPVPYRTSAELMNLLAKNDRVRRTVERKLVQWSLGRPLVKEDETALERIHRASRESGGTYQNVMAAIVTSDLVRQTRTVAARTKNK